MLKDTLNVSVAGDFCQSVTLPNVIIHVVFRYLIIVNKILKSSYFIENTHQYMAFNLNPELKQIFIQNVRQYATTVKVNVRTAIINLQTS